MSRESYNKSAFKPPVPCVMLLILLPQNPGLLGAPRQPRQPAKRDTKMVRAQERVGKERGQQRKYVR